MKPTSIEVIVLIIVAVLFLYIGNVYGMSPIELKQQQEVQAIIKATKHTDSTVLNTGVTVVTKYGARHIACNEHNINADDVEMYPVCVQLSIGVNL